MDINQKVEFIEDIKAYPELYDKDNPHFHDFNKKEDIWNLIGEKFNIPEPKKKWATLRDKYVRLKRLRETAPNSENDGHNTEEKWILYDELSFLNNFCRHRKRSSFGINSSLSNNINFEVETIAPKKMKSENVTTNWKKNSSTTLNPSVDNFEFAAISYNNDDEHSTYDENHEIESDDFFAESMSMSNDGSAPKRIKKQITLPANNKNNPEHFGNSKVEISKLSYETEDILFIKMIGMKLDLLSNRDKNKIQIQILQLVNRELDKCDI